ncbi:hypothetical protein Y032_0032g2607 [Ancylostoma ceylanicum]|uniref:Uncharacterized protein n=1 Tax=Ancylostoma ceylanicum TaxID=53326 RepID=A0A016UQ57_9BILA|nr:hypothetical protein Y032_0032g2607 [Ancylostoma ceylanicum]
MRIVASIGTLVILALVVVLYLKFRKALFVLLIPTAVTVMTVAAIISRRHRLVWPVIAMSMFHVVLACYALLIFSFYFFFKPFYIIMVLNWAFDTAGAMSPLRQQQERCFRPDSSRIDELVPPPQRKLKCYQGKSTER